MTPTLADRLKLCWILLCALLCSQAVAAENLLVNGDFETWSGDKPDHWVAAEAYQTARSAEGEGCGAHGQALVLQTTAATRSHFYQYGSAVRPTMPLGAGTSPSGVGPAKFGRAHVHHSTRWLSSPRTSPEPERRERA